MNLEKMFENRDSFAWQYIRQQALLLVQHPGFKPSERRNIESELWTVLVRKAPGFDPSRGQESTFIARIVDARIRSLVRWRIAAKRHFRHDGQSLNEMISDAGGNLVELGETLDAETAKNHLGQYHRSETELTDLRLDLEHVLSLLNDDGVHQLARLLMVMSRHAASKEPGQSRRKVAKHFEKLRELIEDSDLREYL